MLSQIAPKFRLKLEFLLSSICEDEDHERLLGAMVARGPPTAL